MKNPIYILLFFYSLIAGFTIYFFDGTGDAGDSVMHYLYAKYAPVHPELFFHHWAKPLFVLVASPFAQFGFTGIKIFNALVSLTTIFLTYKICCELKIKNAIIVAIILIFTPLYYILAFSGLTEPLFALFLSAGIYAVLKEKYILSCLLISFLPFVRSEGLIIIGIFVLYLLLKRKWKFLPLLLAGHVVYSIAGFFVYHDLLWVFTKIPYAGFSSPYGSGGIFHFAKEMIDVVGVPIYFLFGIGTLVMIWMLLKKKLSLELQVLVLFGFIVYFSAHSLFWYFGIFGSMGLKRVLLGIVPLIAIISLEGFNFITEKISEKNKMWGKISYSLLISYVIIFPFTPNPSAIIWKNDMMLSAEQQCAIQIANFIIQQKGKEHRFIFMAPYLSEVLNIDCFDKSKKLDLTNENLSQLKKDDIIIWDNWYSVVEGGVTKEQLNNNTNLINFYNANFADEKREINFSAYELK
ncbi:MAG: hypothetical protein HY063_04965 [Bacteroidetes bacterium]|nr:hypothetical protein [Bacteroidota bacterium]